MPEEKDLLPEIDLKKAKQVYLLNTDQITHYWADIVQGLTEVPDFYKYYSPEWAYQQALMGHLQVWALSDGMIRAIVFTQIKEFPRKRLLDILAAYGVGLIHFIEEMQTVFDKFAEANGCQMLGALCRPGLARILNKTFVAETMFVSLRRQVRPQRSQ